MTRTLLLLVFLSGCSLKVIPPDHPSLVRIEPVPPNVWDPCAKDAKAFLEGHPDFGDLSEPEKTCLIHQLMVDCVDHYLKEAVRNSEAKPWQMKAIGDDLDFTQKKLRLYNKFCPPGSNTERVRRIVEEVQQANAPSLMNELLWCPAPGPSAPAVTPVQPAP